MPPYQGGGEMIGHVSFSGTTWADLPFKFEAGTPDYVGAAALTKALDYMETACISRIAAHEHELLKYTTERMLQIPGLRIYGTAPGKAAVISFLLGNAHHYDTGILLDQLGIEVRTAIMRAAAHGAFRHRGHSEGIVCPLQHSRRSGCIRRESKASKCDAEWISLTKPGQQTIILKEPAP